MLEGSQGAGIRSMTPWLQFLLLAAVLPPCVLAVCVACAACQYPNFGCMFYLRLGACNTHVDYGVQLQLVQLH